MFAEIPFQASDGVNLRVRASGVGRPVLLIHGFLADAERNWITTGVAQALLAAGRKVILPDLRGHGGSDKPRDLDFWRTDVLVRDQLELAAALNLGDFDLVGYSLGARTAVRMMVQGAQPRRAVLGGMGASGVMQAGERAMMFEDAIRNGPAARDPRAGRRIQRMIDDAGLDRDALLGVLASFAETSAADLLQVRAQTLVLCGEEDTDNGSPDRLAELIPKASVRRIPGDHLTAVASPTFAEAIGAYLGAETLD